MFVRTMIRNCVLSRRNMAGSTLTVYFLLFCLLVWVGGAKGNFSLPNCNDDGTFTIVEGQYQSITCTGLTKLHNIYWSITRENGQEEILGKCTACKDGPCPNCEPVHSNYNMTRTVSNTTLTFEKDLNENQGARLKCSNRKNSTQPFCDLRVSTARIFSLPKCSQKGKFTLVEGKPLSITCDGLTNKHNIYWSITDSNGQEQRLGECRECGSSCQSCVPRSDDYTMNRTDTQATLTFVKNQMQFDDSVLKCSSFLNDSQTNCTLNVIQAYSLPSCHNNKLQVLENGTTSIACFGLTPWQNMQWRIILNGTDIRAGLCDKCPDSCSDCTVLNRTRYNVTRERKSSELQILRDARKQAGATISCSRADGITSAQCLIRVVNPGKVANVKVTLHPNFTVSASVEVTRFYDSDNNVSCKWFLTCPNQPGVHPVSANLTPYSEDPVYYNVLCEASLSVTQSCNLSVRIDPGHESVFVGTIIIEEPDELALDTTSCPSTVTEGSSVQCECGHSPSGRGSPPAKVFWAHNTSSAVLDIRDVKKDQNGTVFVCRSLWGPNKAVHGERNYTMFIAIPEPEQAENTGKEESSGINIIVGAVVAVVCIGVVIIVVVIVVRKRRKAKDLPFKNVVTSSPGDDEFVEYINDCYQSSDEIGAVVGSSTEEGYTNQQQLTQQQTTDASQSEPGKVGEGASHEDNGVYTEVSDDLQQGVLGGADTKTDVTSGREPQCSGGDDVGDLYSKVQKPKGGKRKGDKQKQASNEERGKAKDPQSNKGASSPPDDDEFVEYINDCYQSSDEIGAVVGSSTEEGYTNQQQLTQQQTTDASQSEPGKVDEGASHEDNSIYTEVSDDLQQGVLGGADTKTDVTPEREPQCSGGDDVGDLYSQVQKPKGDKRQEDDKHNKKKPKRGKRKGDNEQKQTSNEQPENDITEYANCAPDDMEDDSSDLYMNIAKSSPLPADTDKTETTKADDDYNNLQFVRPDQSEPDPDYSHLGQL